MLAPGTPRKWIEEGTARTRPSGGLAKGQAGVVWPVRGREDNWEAEGREKMTRDATRSNSLLEVRVFVGYTSSDKSAGAMSRLQAEVRIPQRYVLRAGMRFTGMDPRL